MDWSLKTRQAEQVINLVNLYNNHISANLLAKVKSAFAPNYAFAAV